MAKITVIGSFVMDNVVKMKSFPEAGETVLGKSIELFPGGKGANQCVSVARLGGDVEMIGMLGKDAYAEVFRRILKEEGIASLHVFSCDCATAIAQIQINEEGQNRICVVPSANHCFDFSHLDEVDEVLKNTETVILQLEMRLDVTKEIIRRAHAYGVRVLLNPAPAAPIEPEILAMVDYITPNETELSLLTDMPTQTDEEVRLAAEKLLGYGTGAVVATLGSRGAMLATKEGATLIPGYRVKAVDTVAAGDSFNGAFAVALSEGKSAEEAVRFANAMGALTVGKAGAIPSLHTRAEVEAFIAKNG